MSLALAIMRVTNAVTAPTDTALAIAQFFFSTALLALRVADQLPEDPVAQFL